MSDRSKTPQRGGGSHGGNRGGFMGGGPGFGMPAEKPKNFRGTFRRLLGYLRPRYARIIVVFALSALSTIFAVVSPKLMGNATTKIFQGVVAKLKHQAGASIDFAFLAHLVMILIGLYLISALFGYLQQFIMAEIAQKTVYDMRRDVNEKLSRLPLSFFDSRTHGEIMSRVTNDVDNIANTLQQSVTQLISSIVTMLGVTVMMLTISPLLTVVTILIVPLSFFGVRFIMPHSQKYFAAQWKHVGELNGHIEENYTGHQIVKAFGRERASIDQFDRQNGELYEASWRAQFISGIIMPVMNFVSNIGYVIVCVVGGVLVTRRAIQIGDVQAFIQYARQFTMPITQTANIANILQSTIASAERVFELLDEEEEQPDGLTELPQVTGTVRFDGVDFRYKEEIPLIENMNIEVKPGQIIAIVGPTGAGKTTIVNLLMRFYELNSGAISIDGKNIRDIRRSDLRKTFGMVLQDTWLFGGTIRDNIAYGRDGATTEQIEAAAATAHADHFIRTLPDGYDTVLNEEASNISQGERQLLTIARAILADPAILILDEATSSVDTRTEVQIQHAMVTLMKGRTSFVIAHRLSTIRDADLILVMDNGSIVETGTHQELLARNGFYAELYNSQFAQSAIGEG
ncbi:MAG TPA: ABC transporter ATP-binding protein [Spirochaetia bacterium]|nr:ABC transporter ATP-binding protein [Spirochaetia bacterium]